MLCWLSTAGMIDVAPQETPGYFPATTVCAAAFRSERLIDLLFSEKTLHTILLSVTKVPKKYWAISRNGK